MIFDAQPSLDQRIKAACDALASVIAVVEPEPAVTAACALLARQLNGASIAITRVEPGEKPGMSPAEHVIAQYPSEDSPGALSFEAGPRSSSSAMLVADITGPAAPATTLIARRGRRELPFNEADRHLFMAVSRQISPLLQGLAESASEQFSGPIDPETGIWTLGRFLEEAARRFDRLDIEDRPGTMLAFGWVRSDNAPAPEASSIIVRASVEVLQDMLRPTDLLGRIGPFRLAAWCDGVDHLIAAERAARIGARLDTLLAPSARHVAIGIATRWTHRREDTTALLEQAGSALLKARSIAASKGQYVSYVWQQSDRVM
jgi:GGDEF domain-containing protein